MGVTILALIKFLICASGSLRGSSAYEYTVSDAMIRAAALA